MTAPVASCGTAMGCRTGMGCSVRGRPPIGSASRGWWPPHCRPPGPLPSAGRCCWAAPPGHRRSWCTSNPSLFHNRTTGARHIAALILIIEPKSQHRIDPDLVAGTLGLTPMESRVAAGLAEGKSVRDMAEAMGRTPGSIYWHLKQIYQKQPISRQADLVRLVLSITEFG